jgi:DNA-binding GntR family transcriptional regulator
VQPRAPLERAPLRERIHGVVRERIVRGGIPPGAAVRDWELAAELGASRTPVREALIRLVSDGLLESRAGRGFRVPPLVRRDVEEAHPLMQTLEPLALASSAPCTDEQARELERLGARIAEQADAVARNELDSEWHRRLISGCPNTRLLRYVDELRTVLRRYELAYLRGVEGMELSVVEHRAIAGAFADGDLAGAATLLAEHWRRAREELLATLPEEDDEA